MNIGMLTTWEVPCGIYEYSRNLCRELAASNKVVVLSNDFLDGLVHTNYGDIKVFGYCFGTPMFNQDSYINIDDIMGYIKRYSIEVLHVQYHSSLYRFPEFTELIKKVKEFNVKTFITVHDSSRHPGTNLSLFDHVIYHKQGIVPEEIHNKSRLPYPIQDRTAKVFSFGMGRNDYARIENICRFNEVEFDWHDSKKHGWISEQFLFERMKDADAIVLWYNDVHPLIGASAAARTAIASRRPVILNDIGWFSDIDEAQYTNVYKTNSLSDTLPKVLNLELIKETSFGALAKRTIELYQHA